MSGTPFQSITTFQQVSELLEEQEHSFIFDPDGPTRAAVAMILHQGPDDMEVLFIQRAAHELDPWSGHLAFPGGKLEAGERACEAARRETLEEVGIDLNAARYLGRLADIVGANLPVAVSCCVFGVDKLLFVPALNEEVSALFWVSLSELRQPERHVMAPVAFDDRRLEVPAIRLPGLERPVLWGITYRLLMQLLELPQQITVALTPES
jgi:8-oxo-dGTP pyrophosphatase MutT (NUDIX family)